MKREGELQDNLVMNDDRSTVWRRMTERAVTLGRYCRTDTGNTGKGDTGSYLAPFAHSILTQLPWGHEWIFQSQKIHVFTGSGAQSCSARVSYTRLKKFNPVLVSAGIELIFFLPAGPVPCFGFSMTIMLITHWCFRCCWVVLTLKKGHFSFPCSASKEVHKKLGRNMARRPVPN